MKRAATLRVNGVSKHLGDLQVLDDTTLDVMAGRITVLLGPSGCGKTTLLRLIAGLDTPDAGSIVCDETTISTPSHVMPPRQRHIGLVFQDGVLFDHLSVGENVGYGLLERSSAAAERIASLLRLVDLEGYEQRATTTLSGGQRQRVALARALGPDPKVLLLDEPFANLDAILRRSLRRHIKQLLATYGTTALFVTHDREEAFAVADQVALMCDGAIVQVGAPDELYERPASRWVAEFLGPTNWLRPASIDVLASTTGPASGSGSGSGSGSNDAGAVDVAIGDDANILVRPHQFRLTPEGPATVTATSTVGSHSTIVCDHPGIGLLAIDVVGPPSFSPGDRVTVSLACDRAVLASVPSPVP